MKSGVPFRWHLWIGEESKNFLPFESHDDLLTEVRKCEHQNPNMNISIFGVDQNEDLVNEFHGTAKEYVEIEEENLENHFSQQN